ncbi:U32 family peptidase [Deltaproteobacteria bacterium TL4]
MKLSVAYNFEKEIIPQLAHFEEVHEIYAKLDQDYFGGGRSSYTLPHVSKNRLKRSIKEAHQHGLTFNYLINGATLNGIEQTRQGQKKIRQFLEYLTQLKVDSLTITSPYLLRLVKTQYPHFKIRVSAFAMVDSLDKALQWEDLGADTICLSALACNRDFKKLALLRKAATCELQLIVNASCLLHCSYEPTHMNLLTNSSQKGHSSQGFCLDYCVLHCSSKKLRHPLHYIKSTWIRPEDLKFYEELGYDNYKIVERSISGPLLLKRVKAYVERSFEGNLLEIAGPVAKIKKQQGASLFQRAKVFSTLLKPRAANVRSLLLMKNYADRILFHDYSQGTAPIYIDNKGLDGFLEGLLKRDCGSLNCAECKYCDTVAQKQVKLDKQYQQETLELASKLDSHLNNGLFWF